MQEEQQWQQVPPLWRPIERKCLSFLQQCKSRKTLLQIHALILRNSIETNVNLVTKFIANCASFALIGHARKVFDNFPQRGETFLCNSMINAHVGVNQFAESFVLYRDLRRETVFVPNNFTFTVLAKSCGLSVTIWEGLEIHCQVLKSGFGLDLFILTGLVGAYGKFGELRLARKVFYEMSERNSVSWTALIKGYVRSGDMGNAKLIFDRMTRKDSVAHNVMIDGYIKVGDMDSARNLFDRMPKRNVVSWTTMISGYCYNGNVLAARYIFDTMPEKNLVTWNAMIGGYCQNKQPCEAINLFHELQLRSSLEPNKVTIVSILLAVADLGALQLGHSIHQYVQQKKLDREGNVCTALVDMYTKCGDISKARRVFDEMHVKGTVTWNALINGLAINGYASEALETFLEMQREGVKPNDVTMIGILSACNHGGLVEEGRRWFKAMVNLGITPKLEHYGCLVDLLGRAGYLEEAENLIETMPYKANAIILSTFLFSCHVSKDIARAVRIFDQAVKLEPGNTGNYIMLRNLYAMENQWSNVQEIEALMRRNGAKKEAGSSAIEVDRRVSEFRSWSTACPEWDGIESVSEQLRVHMTNDLLQVGKVAGEACLS